jgi:phosphate-selective porin
MVLTRFLHPDRGRRLAVAGLFLFAGAVAAQDNAAPAALTLSRRFQLSGFAHAAYTWWEDGIDTFSIKRARLSLAGEIAKNVKMKFQVDLTKSPLLLEASVDVVFKPSLGFRFGQFYVPFGREGRTTTAEIETVQRSQVVEKLAPGRDNGASGRDIGVQIFGKVSVFEYMAGAFNGAGINKTDNNERKDFSARIAAQPTGFLSLGASLYDGRANPAASGPLVVRNRTGVDAALTLKDFLLKAEYLHGRDGDSSRDGWYVQGSYYALPKKLQALAKWDSYDPDRETASDRSDILILGLNWWLTERTRLQANYLTYFRESSGIVNRALVLQFQAGF